MRLFRFRSRKAVRSCPPFLRVTFFALLLLAIHPSSVSPAKPLGDQEVGFSFESVVARALGLAVAPYEDSRGQVPDFLLNMDYDAWRDIRFRPQKSLWRGEALPFELQFFHPGLYYDRSVSVNVVDQGRVGRLGFDTDMFDYGRNEFANDIPTSMGFAGFRVHFPVNRADYKDEFLVFLGASYLRAVPKGQYYGLSARGLAVDTASPKGEEFPWFREFWIVKPKPQDTELTIYALLDSPSVTGAYRYVAKPGVSTEMEVSSVLFLRKPVEKLGIAPLTSMYFFGENSRPESVDDFRPEVHDSDGLQIQFSSGEWLFRPLKNPKNLAISAFEAESVRGFGLLQRDRDFGSFQDLEAHYHQRPNLWIEPRGDWGSGRLELVEIPTPNEMNDNIVAYWSPARMPKPGVPMSFDYVMRWQGEAESHAPAGHAISTRAGQGSRTGSRLFVVDFKGGALESLAADAPVMAVISVDEGAKLLEQQVMRNQATGGWRLSFLVLPDASSALDKMLAERRSPVELRAFLQQGSDVLTETWSYSFKP
ncbi:periplasmic glucans biosynthesis protein [Desulfocurvibacter africanus PCS]|uniref:Glucans biosynthesis protein G n=1 Tax=Desulfocurvibacter africanus PCS TaxID=1262666 RepID=M5PPF9_DESAF|nr:glucan biosynthesis protein G [Desulfocurvibacter africanus]EMG36152.1 periplasmic glucans biosynthesis protein [Desulfocurvibacter africanus PCS]